MTARQVVGAAILTVWAVGIVGWFSYVAANEGQPWWYGPLFLLGGVLAALSIVAGIILAVGPDRDRR